MITSPLMSRLHLGDELRKLRDARGLTGAQLGERTGLGRVAISRVERAERRTRLSVVMQILDSLEVPDDSEEYRRLLRVARSAERRGWWEGSDYAAMGARQIRAADIESGATTICDYHPTMLPGLLQTEAFARHRAQATLSDGAVFDLDVTLAGRLRRQHQLTDATGLTYEAVVEELAIRRLVVPAEVMCNQLTHLLDLISHTAISVRVLPVDAQLDVARVPRSPFSIYTYGTDDPTLVSVDTVTEDILVTDPAETGRYRRLYDRLRDAARTIEDSAALIHSAADHLAVVAGRT
nr:helix-turn-helix transcriptional regulator [Micromonospora sp. DSM 115978]